MTKTWVFYYSKNVLSIQLEFFLMLLLYILEPSTHPPPGIRNYTGHVLGFSLIGTSGE